MGMLGLLGTVAALARAAEAQARATSTPPADTMTQLVLPVTEPAISETDLRRRLYALADDSLLGREAGARGGWVAAEMIAAAFKALGLQPAGERGTFFQNVPLMIRRVDSTSTLVVNSRPLALWIDFVPLTGERGFEAGPQRPIDGATAIFGGTLGDTARMLAPVEGAGKLVVLGAPRGPKGKRDAHYWRFAGLNRFPDAAGVAVAVLDLLTSDEMHALQRGSVQPVQGAVPVPTGLLVSERAAGELLGRPVAGARVGLIGLEVHGAPATRVVPTPYRARNVIAVLPGADAILGREYVALSAHHDHLGFTRYAVDHDSLRAANRARTGAAPAAALDSARRMRRPRADSVYNGADDDASGTAALLEIAEELAGTPPRPQRSILFISHTAEEAGLLGSAWFTDHPTVPRDSIVAEIDLDMVGRGRAEDVAGGGPAYLEVVGARRLSTELGALIDAQAARQRPPFVINYAFDAPGHPDQDYCRADHFSYARYAIPAINLSRGDHIDYHQVTDEPQYIDYAALARVAQFARDLAVAIADLDHRVLIDHARPDPLAPCAQ